MNKSLLQRGTRTGLDTARSVSGAIGFLLLLVTVPAWAGTAASLLSEQEAVALGLNRPEVIQQLESSIELAESNIVEARTWKNPELSFDQENIGGPDNTTSRSYMLSQTLNLSGQIAIKTEAARQRLDAVTLETSQQRMERTADIRKKFYEVLYHQQLHDIFSEWRSAMDAMEAVMHTRMKAGDISGYDLSRLKREQLFVQASQRQAHAEHDRLTQELLAVTGLPGDTSPLPGVTGFLLPETLPLPLEQLLEQVTSQPDLLAIQLQTKAYATDERLANRWWLTDLTLGAGVKDGENGEGDALLLQLSMPIPLFDRNSAALTRAKASQRHLQNTYKLALSEREGKIRGLWNQASELTGTIQSLAADENCQAIVQTSELAYKAGEIGVLEIIDAYRSSFENRAQILSLMRETRMVRIELDFITGENTQ